MIAILAQTIDVAVDPRDVRLHPRDSDLYTWRYLPERAHLFTKQISKHNAGAYREICRELGNSIEVLAKVPSSGDAKTSSVLPEPVVAGPNAEQCHWTLGLVPQDDSSNKTTIERTSDMSSSSFTRTITNLQSLNQQLSAKLAVAQAQLDAQASRLVQLHTEAELAVTRVQHLEATLQETQSQATQVRHDQEQQQARVVELEKWIRAWHDSAHLKFVDNLSYTSLLEDGLVC